MPAQVDVGCAEEVIPVEVGSSDGVVVTEAATVRLDHGHTISRRRESPTISMFYTISQTWCQSAIARR